MSSIDKTPTISLNQWSASDRAERTDFNKDNAAIDLAVKNLQENFDAAQSTADAAKSAASTAQSTAESANTAASAAQTTANTANTTANNAMPKAGGAFTGTVTVPNASPTTPRVVNVAVVDSLPATQVTGVLYLVRE